jgi:hypothetical protein
LYRVFVAVAEARISFAAAHHVYCSVLQVPLRRQVAQHSHHKQQDVQHSQLPPISELLPRSQRNTTSSDGFRISTAPDEVIEGFCDSLRFTEALSLDLNDTLRSSGAGHGTGRDRGAQQQQQQHRRMRSGAGYAPTWGYASDSSSSEGEELSPPAQRSRAYSDSSSNDSSPYGAPDSAIAVDHGLQMQPPSFIGAFDHLEAAADAAEPEQAGCSSEVSLPLQQQQLLRHSSAGGIGRGEPLRASFSIHDAAAAFPESPQQRQQQEQEQPEFESSPAPKTAASRRATAGDHVVTWYSAVGGSIDFGSPEPPSPQGEESSKATALLRVASRTAAARVAAAAAGVDAAACAAHSEEEEANEQLAAAPAEEASVAASSSSSRQRRRWDSSSQQQQQLEAGKLLELQQVDRQQQQQQAVAVQDDVVPRWPARPSWAAAGLAGYRCATNQ